MYKFNIMVTLLKIKNLHIPSLYFDIVYEFKETHGIDMGEFILVYESECTNYEYLYVFLPLCETNNLIKLINEHGVELSLNLDFTKQLTKIVMENKLDEFKAKFILDYNIEFDELIDIFYDQIITVDMVLDKANLLGFKSLTTRDYNVLK